MGYTDKQIEKFIPSGEITDSVIVADKSLGGDVNKIFDKQKKLRESLAQLIQACYQEIHKTADNRQKKIVEFNDKYLVQTIIENVPSIDTSAIEDKIEELIIEKYVSLKVLDQVKLKGYVWKILNQGYEEYHKDDSKDDESETNNQSKSNGTKQTSIDIFRETLGNEDLMIGIIDRLGGKIIDSQGQFNDNLLEEIGKIGNGDNRQTSDTQKIKSHSPLNNPKTVTQKLSRSQKRRLKRERRAEQRLLKKQQKQLNIQQGVQSIVQSQMVQIEQLGNSLSGIGFGTKRKKSRFGFFRQRIRNVKAIGKRGKRKLTLIGRKFGLFKPKKVEKKTEKQKFLEMYNKMALKNLYARIDEFDKGKIMGKPKKERLIKKIGGFVWGAIKKIGKMVWNLGKFVFKSLWKVTKKIFSLIKVGFTAIISKLKWFIASPAGAYITGFIAGLIWHGLIQPVINWEKKLLDKILKYIGFDSLDDIMSQKEDILYKMRAEFSQFITEHGGSIQKIEKLFQSMEYLGAKLDSFEAMTINFAENTVGTAINTACTTVGVIIGSFFGPIGALVGGALGKAVGMAAEYFYKQIPDSDQKEIEKNLVIERMRKRYNGKPQRGSHQAITVEKIAADNEKMENEISKIEEKLKDKDISKYERDKLERDKEKYLQLIKENNSKKDILESEQTMSGGQEEEKLRNKIDNMYKYVSRGANYLNIDLKNGYDFSIDFKRDDFDIISDDGDKRKMLLARMKKHSFIKAYKLLVKGKIAPSHFQRVAQRNLDVALDARLKRGSGTNGPTIREYIFDTNRTISTYRHISDFDDYSSYQNEDDVEKLIESGQLNDVKIKNFLNQAKEKLKKIGLKMGQSESSVNYVIDHKYSERKILEYAINQKNIHQKPSLDGIDEKFYNDIWRSTADAYWYNGNKDVPESSNNDIHWLTGSLRLMGKAIYSTEHDEQKRKLLEDQMNVALGRMDIVEEEKRKEEDQNDEKFIKAKDKVKVGLETEISQLKAEKRRLLKGQPKKSIKSGVRVMMPLKQDVEMNANADNDGSSDEYKDHGNQSK